MIGGKVLSKLLLVGADESTSYNDAMRVLEEGSHSERRRLAQRKDTRPEFLYYLTEDPEPDVRRAIAGNPTTPPHADLVLARDKDDNVRKLVAERLPRRLPEVAESETPGRHRDVTLETIQILAGDALPQVRAIVSETLAEVTGTPPRIVYETVKKLAMDAVLEVAGPVLQRSVLLTEDDLIEVIEHGPPEGALAAMAGRAELGPRTADGIAAGNDSEAIAILLGNKSAQIREETLDLLVERAPQMKTWHAPLVRRPKLSATAARRIAGFVAQSLLQVLAQREDLDPETTQAVSEAVQKRLEEGEPPVEEVSFEDNMAHARALLEQGSLTEAEIIRMVSTGNRNLAIAGLSVAADIAPEAVTSILESKNPKAVTALTWKAGFSMKLAVQLQVRLSGVPLHGILNAKSAGRFPMKDEDMEWQIEFYTE